MATVIIHATVTLDGFMADVDGEVAFMDGTPEVPADGEYVQSIVRRIGAVVGGANRAQTVEEGEEPYGGMLGVPVYLMTRSPHEPIVKGETTYTFVVDDVADAVARASADAGDRVVSVLGGRIGRECLRLGLIDEIHLHVVPMLLGDGIPLFTGLGTRVDLERIDSAGYAQGVHLSYRVVK